VTIVDHAGVLARFLGAKGIREPVLVGHSMGTQVVSQLAIDFPDVTDRIVMMAPTMDPAARTLGAAASRLLRDILKEPVRVKVIVAVDYFIRCGIPYFLRQVPHLLKDRIEERLPRITAKCLVMRGDGDVISPDEWAREVTSLLRDGRFVSVEGPHIVMFTDPVSVAAEIARHGRS
jgi:pimeloyl-ACP methyl ester carboxylesterase